MSNLIVQVVDSYSGIQIYMQIVFMGSSQTRFFEDNVNICIHRVYFRETLHGVVKFTLVSQDTPVWCGLA